MVPADRLSWIPHPRCKLKAHSYRDDWLCGPDILKALHEFRPRCFHTCHTNRHLGLLPFYTIFTDLVLTLGGGYKVSAKQKFQLIWIEFGVVVRFVDVVNLLNSYSFVSFKGENWICVFWGFFFRGLCFRVGLCLDAYELISFKDGLMIDID